MAWDKTVPITKQGDPLWYDSDWRASVATYKQVEEWEDVLHFKGFRRGRSSVKAIFQSRIWESDLEMFLTDFEKSVRHLDKGHLQGQFVFAKRGANYGVRLIID